eukprot:UN14213
MSFNSCSRVHERRCLRLQSIMMLFEHCFRLHREVIRWVCACTKGKHLRNNVSISWVGHFHQSVRLVANGGSRIQTRRTFRNHGTRPTKVLQRFFSWRDSLVSFPSFEYAVIGLAA